MRRELVVKARSLCGVSDLTLLAPIKQGLVPSLETVSYKTRAKRLLEALNVGRASSHEYALWRPISDSVERVGRIHSVRVAVLEPEDKILLAVTFDGAWQSYIRVLWQKVGTLLDVIFCNTEDYVSAYGHSFEEWKGWAERVQVETAFFYGMPGLTVGDVDYLRQAAERPLAAAQEPALAAVRATGRSAEKLAQDNVKARGAATIKEMGRQGLLALASIHRLTSMYLPGKEDGEYLRRAARDLLLEFVKQNDTGTLKPIVVEGMNRFEEQLIWLLAPTPSRSVPGTPTQAPVYDGNDVQGGIVKPYERITHGCLLLMAFKSPAAAASFLQTIHPLITRDAAVPTAGELVMNLAFSYEGLRAIGVSEAQLAFFPQEFREGMAARAGVLGDLRTNHPRRWRLPERNWPPSTNPSTQKIELSAVHVVLQLRIADGSGAYDFNDSANPFPLHGHVTALLGKLPGVDLLSVQPMVRHLNKAQPPQPQEHFGFVDGEGQPVIDPAKAPAPYGRNAVQLGELLLGYANAADLAPDPLDAPERHKLLHNGSFLVLRKLHQDVQALTDAVNKAESDTGLSSEEIYAKMMGRKRDGEPLVPRIGASLNNFDYEDDPQGKLCPFHAHIRRANPRFKDDANTPPGGRMPRITRRGMPYGPLLSTHPDVAERGLMFMAYSASISEQFELVQRWLSGGNSSGGYSGQSDPFLGVAENGKRRFFEFEDEKTNTPWRIALDGSPVPLTDPRPFVRLEWGCYLFTPSIKALDELFKAASNVQASRPVPPWSAAAGMKDIQVLREIEQRQGAERALEAWKTLLEDPQAQQDYQSASVWAAIRAYHAGVLRTPYGVIVASHSRVMEVLDNAAGHYSVSGYHQRMIQSIGEIFLGLDDDKTPACPYNKQARETNGAIGQIKREEAFDLARESTTKAMIAFVKHEQFLAKATGETRWELQLAVKEVVDKVLEDICMQWFGLPPREERPAPQKSELKPGGARWDWKEGEAPLYPGNFTAPSRYLFQPQPGAVVEELGRLYGRTLTEAFRRLVKRHRDGGTAPQNPKTGANARLAEAIFDAFPSRMEDDLVARTMVGALMGFIPTVDGNLRLSLNEWLRDGTFWELRAALAGADPNKTPYQRATALETPLIKAMQLRPSPELVWRTAKTHHKIGGVEIWPEDKIVVALVSATHESLEQGKDDTYLIFGGDRSKTEHPTHACPAYEAAMGLLLGMLSGMLEFTETMRPSPAALALSLEGNFPPAPGTPPPPPLNSITARAPAPPPAAPAPQEVVKPPMILAAGDSWFAYSPISQPGKQLDMLQMLRDRHGFDTVSLAEAGHTLEAIASKQQLDALCDRFNDLVARGRPPVAILLSAGVYDVVYKKLALFLQPRSAAGEGGLSQQVDALVDVQMRGHLKTIFTRLAQDCRHGDQPAPVFFHGYDYLVPDGRNAFDIKAPRTSWLSPVLLKFGYTKTSDDIEIAELSSGIDIMKKLIFRLNQMQIGIAEEFCGHVFHVDLRAQLSNDPKTYKEDWANELHPTEPGFARITQELVEQMAVKVPALTGALK